jgi:hypothetical protein
LRYNTRLDLDYIYFHKKRHPEDMGAEEIRAYLFTQTFFIASLLFRIRSHAAENKLLTQPNKFKIAARKQFLHRIARSPNSTQYF